MQGQLREATRRLGAGTGDAGSGSTFADALGLALRELRAIEARPRKGRAQETARISRLAERLAQFD